jgi:hypothetical protein
MELQERGCSELTITGKVQKFAMREHTVKEWGLPKEKPA